MGQGGVYVVSGDLSRLPRPLTFDLDPRSRVSKVAAYQAILGAWQYEGSDYRYKCRHVGHRDVGDGDEVRSANSNRVRTTTFIDRMQRAALSERDEAAIARYAAFPSSPT